MAATKVQYRRDLDINIEIRSVQKRPLIALKDETLGYVDDHLGFLRVQVQKEIGGKYQNIRHHGLIDNAPTELDTLYYGDVRKFDISFAILYNFKKGNYRIRILGAFSFLNPGSKDVYSDWLYFTCKRESRLNRGNRARRWVNMRLSRRDCRRPGEGFLCDLAHLV